MLELPSLTFYPFLPHTPSEAVPGAPALYQAEGFFPPGGPGGDPCLFHILLAKPRIWSTLSKGVTGKFQSAETLPGVWGGGDHLALFTHELPSPSSLPY